MGKLRRGALWAIFPPAGAVASVNASAEKRANAQTQRLLDAQAAPVGPPTVRSPVEWEAHAKTVRQAMGRFPRKERARRVAQAYQAFMYEGVALDEAISAASGRPGSSPASAPPA